MGIGECALFRGLSCDDRPDYEEKMQWLCDHIDRDTSYLIGELMEFPSIQFGLEQALLSLKAENSFDLFPSDFSRGKGQIPINGLIWMGDKSFMTEQIAHKLEEGFTTLKMKIGAIDFQTELDILKGIRKRYNAAELVLRVDANGAFNKDNALDKLKELAAYDIHSIEQPIQAGQWEQMNALCASSPVAIALDEELIGLCSFEQKRALLQAVHAPFLIFKPSLIGGFRGTKEWIQLAEEFGIEYWITSALESNIGLNAIAQFTYTLKNPLPQGLGTGGLFSNNIDSPLCVQHGALLYDSDTSWAHWEDVINRKN